MGRTSARRIPVDGITVFFIILAVVSGGALLILNGVNAFSEALGNGLDLMLEVMPLVVLAVLVAAYVQHLLPMDFARRWLGGSSGLRGLLIATVAGMLTPGGPFAAFPLVLGMRGVGASIPVCITYLTAWSMLGLQRIVVWEIPFFGPHFVLVRVGSSFLLPLVAGLIAMALVRFAGEPT